MSSLSVTQTEREKVLGVTREEIVSYVHFEKFKIYSYPEAVCGKYFCDFSLYLFLNAQNHILCRSSSTYFYRKYPETLLFFSKQYHTFPFNFGPT